MTDDDNDVTENGPGATGGGDGGEPPGSAPTEPPGGSPGEPQDTILSLAQVIGSPIHALVDAEAQSALATTRFIRTVGFKKPADGTNGDFGDLRMAQFTRVRTTSDGEQRDEEIQIPLLTLLPIPALQIRDAELEYYVKVIQTETLPEHRAEVARSLPDDGIALEPPATVRAAFSSEPRSDARRSIDMLLKMKVHIEQADMPNGLAKLLNLAGESVRLNPQQSAGDGGSETSDKNDGQRGGRKSRK